MFEAREKETGKIVRGYLIKLQNSNEYVIVDEDGMEWVDGSEWRCGDFYFIDITSILYIGI